MLPQKGIFWFISIFIIFLRVQAGPIENEVREYCNTIDKQMFPMYETIHALTFGRNENQYLEKLDLLCNIADAIAVQTKEAQLFNPKNIDHKPLRVRVKNIRRSAYLYILGADYFRKFEKLVNAMMQPASLPIMCDYKQTDNCNLVYLADIRTVMNNGDDSDELKYYWSEYRKNNENIGHYVFPEFIELWIKAANDTAETPVEFLYNSYADGTMSSNMKRVMDEIMPFYKEFHAVVRHKLNKKYGDYVISKTGLIPHHLFEIIALQAWKKESALEHAYPEKRLPNLLAGMEKEGLDAEKIIQIAEYYYTTMGFEPLSDKIRANYKKLPGKSGSSIECRGQVYDQTPNVQMEYCPQVHFKKFLQMHGYMGKLHYANEKRELPFSFFNSYNFEDAVGEAIILSASSTENIMKLGFASSAPYAKELDMNRLFRMGVHTWFNIPVYYVHVKLMEDLLNGVTNFDDINIHYWKLMEEHAGVEPPFDRNITSFDLPVKFYEDIKLNRLVTKFVSEVLGYQFYDSLCKLTGKYGQNATTISDLHNCNLEGNKLVGQKLKEMMSTGSKRRWQKVLEIVTGSDNGLSGEGLLNYYKPLQGWIRQYMNDYELQVGWGKSSKVFNGNHQYAGKLTFRSYDLPTIRFDNVTQILNLRNKLPQ